MPISTPTSRLSSRSSGRKKSSSAIHLRLDLVKFGRALDPLRADGEERFHRLDEDRKRDPVGKRGRCGDVDRPEGRDRFGKDAGLRQARQIFVLADEADLRVRTGQPQRLGKDRSERGSWIVVGADDRRDIAVPRARRRCARSRQLDRRRRRDPQPCRRSAPLGWCWHSHGTDSGGRDGQAWAAPDGRGRSSRPREHRAPRRHA